MDINVDSPKPAATEAEQASASGSQHGKLIDKGSVENVQEEEGTSPIIDGQSYSHASPNLEAKQIDGPLSVDTSSSSSSSSPNELDQTFSIDKSSNSNSMDLTFSLCDDEEEEDDDEMEDGEGAEYDITTGSTITGNAGGGGESDLGGSSILLQNMSHHSFDDIQFFPSSHHRAMRLQPQFQFHQDQLNDPNFHLAPNLSCFDASGLVNLSGSGSVSNSYSLINGDPTSGDINSAFSESPFVFPDNVMEYGEPQFFPGNCVGYLETILEDDEEIEEEEGCSGRHWWTADSDTDTDSVIRVDNNGQTQQQEPIAFQHTSSMSLTIPGEKDEVKHHFRSSASSKPFELEDLHLFDQLDHAFEETLSEPKRRAAFGFLHQSQSAEQPMEPNNSSLNNAAGGDDIAKGCQKSLPCAGGESQNAERKTDNTSMESVGNSDNGNEVTTKGLNMLTKENVKAHSVENSNIIYEVSEEKEQNSKKLGNAESRETFGSSLSPSSSDSEAPPEVAEEDFFYSSPGSDEEECRSQEETETDSCSSDDSEKKGVVLAEFSLGSSGGSFNSGMLFGNNKNRRSFEAPSRLKSFRSFDSLNCLAGTELLFSKPETFPSIDHIREVSEPSSESESSNDRNLIPEEDEEDISEEDKMDKIIKHVDGPQSLPIPSSNSLLPGPNSNVICNKNSTSSSTPIINTNTTTSGAGLRSTENLSEDSGIGNDTNDGISTTAASTPGAFIEESNVIMSSNGKQPHEDCKKGALNGSSSPTALKIIAVQEADKSSLQLDSAKDFISSAEFALNPFVYSSLSSSEPESSISSLTCNGGSSLHSINKMNVTYNDQSLTQTHLNGKERAIPDPTKDQETTSNNKSHESLISSAESPQLLNGESKVDGNMSRHRSKLSPPPSPEQTKTVSSNLTQDIMNPGNNNESSQDRHKNGCEGQPIIITNSAVATPFLSDANREQHPAKNSPSIEELASISKSALPSYFSEPPVGSQPDREICVTNNVIKTVSTSPSVGEVFSMMSKVDEEEQEHSSSSSYSSSSGDEQNVPRFHRQRSDSESEYELAENALQKDNEKMAYDIIVNSPKKKKGLEELSSSSSSSLSSSSLAHEQLTLSSTSTSAPTIQPAKHQIHNSPRQDELNTNKCNEKSGPVSALSSSSLINIHRNGDDDHGTNMQSDRGGSASGGEKEKNNLANTPGMRNERLPVFESCIDDYDDDNGHDCVAETTLARIAKTLPMSENIGATSNNNMATTPDCGGMGVSSNVSRYLVCSTPTSQREGHNMKPYSDHRVIENSSTTRFLHHHQLPPDYNNKREQYENSDELTGAPQSQRIHMLSCTGSVVGGGGELSVGNQDKKLSGQVATTQQSQSSPTTNIHQDHHNSLRSSVRLDEATSADVAHHQSNNPQRNLIEQQNAFHPAGVAQRSTQSSRAPANNSAGSNRSHFANFSDPKQSQVLAGESPYEEDPFSEDNELVFADSYYPNQIDTAVVKKFLATYVAPKESSGSFFGPLEHKPVSTSFTSTTCAEKDSTPAASSAPTHKSKNKLGNGKDGVAQPASNPSSENISSRSNFGSLHSHTNTYTEAHDHHHHHEYGFPIPSHPVVVQGGKDLHSRDTWEEEPKLVQPLKENNSFCPSSIQKTSPIQYTVGSNTSVKRSVSPSSLPSSKRQDIGKGAARGDQHNSTKDNNIYTGIDKFSVGLCAIKAAVVAVAPSIPSYIVKDDVGTERNSDSGIGKEKHGRNVVRENGALSTTLFPKETVKTCSIPCNSDNTALLKDGEHNAHELTTQPQPSRQTVNVPDILNLNQHSCMPSIAGGYSEEANNKNSVMMEDTSVEMQRDDSPTHSGLPLRTKKYGPRNEVEIVLVSSRTPSPAPGGFVSTSSSFPSSSRKLASSSPTDQEPVCSPKPCYNDDGTNVRESSIPPPPLSPPVTTSTKTHRSRVHFSPVVSEISWRESYIDQSSECSGSTDDLLTKLETLDGIHGVRGHHHHGRNWSEHSDNNESAGLRKGGGDPVGGNNSGDNRVGSDEVGSSKVRPLQVYDIQMATRADSPNSLVSGRGVSPGRGPILVEKVEMTSSLLHDPEEKNNRHLLLGESQPSRKLVLHKDNEDVDNDDEKVTDLVDFRNGANNDICGNDQNNGTLGVYEDVEVQIEPSEKTQVSTTLSMVPDLLSQCENTSNTLTHIDVKIEESIPELNTKNIVLNIGPPLTNRGNDRHHQPQKKVDKLPQPHELSTSPEPKQIFPKMFAEDKNDKRSLSSSSLSSSSSKPKKPSKGFSIQGLGSSGKKSEKDGAGLNGTNGNSSQTLAINDGGGGESKQEPGVTEAAKDNKKSSKPGFFERLSKIRLSSGSKNKKQKVHPKSGEIHQEGDPAGPPPVTSTIAGTGNAGRPLRSANSVNVNGKSNSSGANNTTPAGFVQPILKKSTASSSTIPTGAGGPQYNGSEMAIIGDSENEPDDANQAFENILEEIAGLKSIQLRQEKSSNSSIDKSPTSQQMRSFAKRKQFYSNAGSPSPPVSPTSNNGQSYADLDSKLTQFKEDTSRTLDAISKSHPDLEAIEDVVKQRQKSLSPEPREPYQAYDMDANKKAMASTLPKSSKAPNSETIQNSEREWYKLLKSATEKYAYHKGPMDDHFYKEHHTSHKTGIVETDLDTGASREMLDEDMLQLDCKVPCYTMSTSEIPTSVASTSVSMVTSAGSPATSAKTRSLTNLSSRLPLSIAPSQFEESTGDLSDSEERAKSLEFLLDENHKSSSVPPENKLRQLETRQLSEHELRIQRSLQRLNVPEWYKQHGTLSTGPINNVTPGTTAQNKSATLSILKRAEYGSSGGLAGGWSGLSTYKAPSMSSLQSNGGRHSGTLNKSNFVRGRPQTMSATRTSKESLLASGSASHSPSAFERSSFTYGMPFTMTRFGQGRLSTHSGSVSPPSTPDSTTKVNSYIKKPYLGWRSQEKLNAANAAAGAGNAAGAPKLSIYLPPAERLAADLLATRAKSPVRPPVSERPPLPKAPPRSEKTTLTRGQGANDEPAETALSSTPVISKQTSMAVVTKLPQQSNSIPPPELSSHGKNGHSQHHSKTQSSPNVHDSIRQVTTAISHFVGRGQHETQPQQRTKPKVGKKPAIWIESSFVGQKPSTK